jgi:ankyrin repeat protein
MMRSLIIGFVSFLVGLSAGWVGRHTIDDGPHGIQWKFTEAAGRGDIAEMKRLISKGADPLAVPSYADGSVSGSTALLQAASAGEPDAVEFLINQGADVSQQESDTNPIGSAEYRLRQTEATIQILRSHLGARAEAFNTKSIKQANEADMGTPNQPPD